MIRGRLTATVLLFERGGSSHVMTSSGGKVSRDGEK